MKKLICTMTLAALLCGAAGAAGTPYYAQARLRPDVPVPHRRYRTDLLRRTGQ